MMGKAKSVKWGDGVLLRAELAGFVAFFCSRVGVVCGFHFLINMFVFVCSKESAAEVSGHVLRS